MEPDRPGAAMSGAFGVKRVFFSTCWNHHSIFCSMEGMGMKFSRDLCTILAEDAPFWNE